MLTVGYSSLDKIVARIYIRHDVVFLKGAFHKLMTNQISDHYQNNQSNKTLIQTLNS